MNENMVNVSLAEYREMAISLGRSIAAIAYINNNQYPDCNVVKAILYGDVDACITTKE